MTKSARNCFACFFTNNTKLSLPTSSSPSIRNVTFAGSGVRVFSQASTALTWAKNWPLLSDAPRPKSFPLRSVGSNGGVFHKSNGSGGCTS